MEKIEFYTVRDIKEILHIGKNKAYALVGLQLFPTIKMENKLLIYKKEFEQWLERMGIMENGRLTSRAGDLSIFER